MAWSLRSDFRKGSTVECILTASMIDASSEEMEVLLMYFVLLALMVILNVELSG